MKDTDHTAMLMRLRTLPFAVPLAGLTIAGAMLAGWRWYYALAAGAVVFVLIIFVPEHLAARGGDVVAKLYAPKGSSTPSLQQYSLADSLLARDRIAEAAEAYRVLAEDFPGDPEPLVRLARLLRDYTHDFEQAAEAYRRALAIEAAERANKAAIMRELIELYTHRMHRPELALPYLARFAQEHATHPAAQWARNEYTEIKRVLQAQHENG